MWDNEATRLIMMAIFCALMCVLAGYAKELYDKYQFYRRRRALNMMNNINRSK